MSRQRVLGVIAVIGAVVMTVGAFMVHSGLGFVVMGGLVLLLGLFVEDGET